MLEAHEGVVDLASKDLAVKAEFVHPEVFDLVAEALTDWLKKHGHIT